MGRRSERGKQTRFDRGPRITLIITLVFAAAVVGLAIASFVGGQRENLSRLDARPRNTDIWIVYPDERVRFAALLYPSQDEFTPGADVQEFTTAGPLVYSMDDVLDTEIIGGDLIGSEMLEGPTGNEDLVYELFRIDHKGEDAYGVNVETQNSAYLSFQSDGSRLLLLGANAQPRFNQVVVAVALPEDALVNEEFAGLEPYRQREVDGWTVYYFNTTLVEGNGSIQLEYFPGQANPETPNLFEIDARR